MEHPIRANPAPVDPQFVPREQLNPNTVGKCAQEMTAKLQEAMDKEPIVVETDIDWAKAYIELRKGLKDTGTLVLDVKRNPQRKMYTLLTIGTMDGTFVEIPVKKLEYNMGATFSELLMQQFADLRGWLLNLSVFKLVHDKDRWMEFAEQFGLPTPFVQPMVQISDLHAAAERQGIGLLPAHFRTDLPDFVYQGLAWKYTGVSTQPVGITTWNKVYPTYKRPVFAHPMVMFEWPDEENMAGFRVKQHEYLNRTHLGICSFMWQLGERLTIRDNQHQTRPYLPQMFKTAIKRSVGPELVSPAGVPCIVDYVIDESEGIETLERSITFQGVAADYFNVREPEDDPWCGTPYRYTGEESSLRQETAYPNWRLGRCERDMVHHWSQQDLCELGRQILNGTVDRSKVRCVICMHWNHFPQACPRIHTRCDKCHRMGHLRKDCDKKTEEQHFLDFVRHILLGFWTALNPGGVLHGPMGFGGGLTFVMTWQYHYLIQDVNAKMMVRRQTADAQILAEFRIACRNLPGRYHQFLRWQIYSDWRKGVDPRSPVHTRHRRHMGPKVEMRPRTPSPTPSEIVVHVEFSPPSTASGEVVEARADPSPSPETKRRRSSSGEETLQEAPGTSSQPRPVVRLPEAKPSTTTKPSTKTKPSTGAIPKQTIKTEPIEEGDEDVLCLQLTPSEMEAFGQEFKDELEETEGAMSTWLNRKEIKERVEGRLDRQSRVKRWTIRETWSIGDTNLLTIWNDVTTWNKEEENKIEPWNMPKP